MVGFFDKYLGGIIATLVVGLVLMYFAATYINIEGNKVIGFMVATAPVWLPISTFYLFYNYWMDFIHMAFDIGQGRTTIEIRLPLDVFKSPEAMELVLIQLYQTASPDNLVQTYWDGKKPPTFSLEIASRGGDVRFYMNVPKKKFKNMAESQLYAQYPGIEIKELEVDYTAEVTADVSKYFIFAFHYGLRKPDPYPIKTYFDFGLNQMPKEEEKTDPITVTLETLGNVGPGEHMWLQILITAHKKHSFKTGSLKAVPDWQKDIQKEIDGIIQKAKDRVAENAPPQLTERERDTISALERSASKYAFNTQIRGLYIAESDKAQPGERLGMLAGIWRQYDDVTRNAMGPIWRTDTDWPWWQDIGKRNTDSWKESEVNSFKKRAMGRMRGEGNNSFIFTTEELATIYHLPGQVAITPTLGRIPSARSEAPSNLPI